jgi:hypothetical protein
MAKARKSALRVVRSAAPNYELRVELKHIKPVIWRRIIVAGSIRLHELHAVLLLAMGWQGGHLHEFIFGDTRYGEPDDLGLTDDPPMLDETRITLAKALAGLSSFAYLYDFGDGWEHRIKIEQVLTPDPELRCPVCLGGRNACPPEDVGGVPGYASFLEAIGDPSHEEHDDFLEWCGGSFDPTAFDIALTNQRLSQIKF